MDAAALREEFQGMDIALIDQVLKGRFEGKTKLLDAGFGSGRNFLWFHKNGYDVHGIDSSAEVLAQLKEHIPESDQNFKHEKLEDLGYPDAHFDIVLCSAVLHFATDHANFHDMFGQLVRVLRSGGILFIRMASDIGLEPKPVISEDGIALLPDGTYRYLLTRSKLGEMLGNHALVFAEVLKTVNVDDKRSMTTLVLQKN